MREVARTVLIILGVPLLAFPLIAFPLMVLTVCDVLPQRIGDWAATGLALWLTGVCLMVLGWHCGCVAGRGRAMMAEQIRCPQCDGRGLIDDPNDNGEITCPTCGGAGEVPMCEGGR